jgi:ribosomal-protein-serine acetyltransferase
VSARPPRRDDVAPSATDGSVDPAPAPAAPRDPAPPHAFALRLDAELALRLRERHHAASLYARLDRERAHLRGAFAWVEGVTPQEVEAMTASGLEQFRRGDGWQADLCWRGAPVGSMGLHYLNGAGGSTEVGYWLAAAHQGNGLLTRAMRGLQRHFFEGRGLGRVAIGLVPGNARSEAVAARLGFAPEAVLRRAHLSPQGVTDLAFFGLLREAWAASPEAAAAAATPLPLPRFALRVDDDLELALFERDDVDALHALVVAQRDHLAPWMPWAQAPTPASTRGFVEGRALQAIAEADGFETAIWWRGRLVGAIGIHGVQREPLRGSIGYWLAADAQGRGLVTRAVRALVAKAFDDLRYRRLDIRADVANARSRAVPERLGFTYEGVLRREFFDGRRYVDQAVYGLLRDEWRA